MKGKYEAKILELKEELESKEEISGGSGGKNVVEEVRRLLGVVVVTRVSCCGVLDRKTVSILI